MMFWEEVSRTACDAGKNLILKFAQILKSFLCGRRLKALHNFLIEFFDYLLSFEWALFTYALLIFVYNKYSGVF